MLSSELPELTRELVLFGNTKIFLRNKAMAMIDKKFQEKIVLKNQKAGIIQRAFFRYKQMKKLRMMFRSMKRMQNLWKVRTEHKNFLNIRKKIIRAQRWWRRMLGKQNNKERRAQAILIQTYIRRFLCSLHSHNRIKSSVVKLQGFFRKGLAKFKSIKYKKMKDLLMKEVFERFWFLISEKNATLIQKRVRGMLARGNNKDIISKAKIKR